MPGHRPSTAPSPDATPEVRSAINTAYDALSSAASLTPGTKSKPFTRPILQTATRPVQNAMNDIFSKLNFIAAAKTSGKQIKGISVQRLPLQDVSSSVRYSISDLYDNLAALLKSINT